MGDAPLCRGTAVLASVPVSPCARIASARCCTHARLAGWSTWRSETAHTASLPSMVGAGGRSLASMVGAGGRAFSGCTWPPADASALTAAVRRPGWLVVGVLADCRAPGAPLSAPQHVVMAMSLPAVVQPSWRGGSRGGVQQLMLLRAAGGEECVCTVHCRQRQQPLENARRAGHAPLVTPLVMPRRRAAGPSGLGHHMTDTTSTHEHHHTPPQHPGRTRGRWSWQEERASAREASP